MIIKANKATTENLVAVRCYSEIHHYKHVEKPITVWCLEGRDWLLHRFIEVNFSKWTESNQIFTNDFVCLYYHIFKISSQINERKFFIPNDFLVFSLWFSDFLPMIFSPNDDSSETIPRIPNKNKTLVEWGHDPLPQIPMFWWRAADTYNEEYCHAAR